MLRSIPISVFSIVLLGACASDDPTDLTDSDVDTWPDNPQIIHIDGAWQADQETLLPWQSLGWCADKRSSLGYLFADDSPADCWDVEAPRACTAGLHFADDSRAYHVDCVYIDPCGDDDQALACRRVDLGTWSFRYNDGLDDIFRVGDQEWQARSQEGNRLTLVYSARSMHFTKAGN